MEFSLIIPCYNESKNIPLLLDRCSKVAVKDKIEVILVDNGSTDDTKEILAKIIINYPGCRTVRVDNNQGYGHGILAGLASANGKILGWTHADMQTDPADVITGLDYFDKHGLNIFCKGKRKGRPLADVFFTFCMSIFESLFMRKLLWDINAQPTMFSKDFFDTWDSPPEDFSLDLYAYFMAKENNLRTYRFPVKFGDRAFGVSHWNISWKSKYNFIKRTISYSIKLKQKVHKK
jgi:glycosyltransferase involved in cell wall biosynthesis